MALLKSEDEMELIDIENQQEVVRCASQTDRSAQHHPWSASLHWRYPGQGPLFGRRDRPRPRHQNAL